MSFTSTRISLADEPDEDMVRTSLEVIELTRKDWEEIAAALDFYRTQQSLNHEERKYFRALERDIRQSIIAELSEETA
jgi:hypothetical protein